MFKKYPPTRKLVVKLMVRKSSQVRKRQCQEASVCQEAGQDEVRRKRSWEGMLEPEEGGPTCDPSMIPLETEEIREIKRNKLGIFMHTDTGQKSGRSLVQRYEDIGSSSSLCLKTRNNYNFQEDETSKDTYDNPNKKRKVSDKSRA